MEIINKKCKKCGLEKSLIEYYKYKSCKDGTENTCKDCRKINRREYIKYNRDKINAAQRIYESNRKKIDLVYRLKKNMQSRIRDSFKYKSHKKKE